jgi:hypothetical protein
MKHLEGVDESHHHLMQCEGEAHPSRSGSGAHSSIDICDINKNMRKDKGWVLYRVI